MNIYRTAGETVTLELLRKTEKLTKEVAVQRSRDVEQILALVNEESELVPQFGVLALDLDGKTTPLLPPVRRLSGVVVAGVAASPSGRSDAFYAEDVIYSVNDAKVTSVAELREALRPVKRGEPVAVQIERIGQLQFLVVEVQ